MESSGGSRDGKGCLRIIDVIPQHVEGVVHAAPEVQAVQVLSEVLPPAHIQQVANELVKALQLCMGEAGERERRKRWLLASLGSKLRAGRASADEAESTVITSVLFPFKTPNHETSLLPFTHVLIPSTISKSLRKANSSPSLQ